MFYSLLGRLAWMIGKRRLLGHGRGRRLAGGSLLSAALAAGVTAMLRRRRRR